MQAVLIKCICLMAFLMIVGINPTAAAAGVCGDLSPDQAAGRLILRCFLFQNLKVKQVKLNDRCCKGELAILKNLRCVYAAVESRAAVRANLNPVVALNALNSCNITDVGK